MKLAELRGSMTQEELAKKLNVSCSSLGKYERGERTPRDNVEKSALPRSFRQDRAEEILLRRLRRKPQ